MKEIGILNQKGRCGKLTIANGLRVSEYGPDGKACVEIKALYEEINGLLGGER